VGGGDVGAGSVEALESGVFVEEPGGVLDLDAEVGFLAESAEDTAVGGFDGAALAGEDGAAFAVHAVVAEVAELAGAVDFGGEEFDAGRGGGAGGAAVDVGLFAAFDEIEDIGDEVLLVERGDGGEEPAGFVAAGAVRGGDRGFDRGGVFGEGGGDIGFAMGAAAFGAGARLYRGEGFSFVVEIEGEVVVEQIGGVEGEIVDGI